MDCEHTNSLCLLCSRSVRRCSSWNTLNVLFPALFLKKYTLKRKIIRTGKKGAAEAPANPDDIEKGPDEKESTEEGAK